MMMPKCPKCGSTMQGGAPHGPWPIQWECPCCGTIVVPPSDSADASDAYLAQPPDDPREDQGWYGRYDTTE